MSYAKKTFLLATQHQKELAIAPIVKQHLECNIWVPNNFNTDQFGTFTGEIKRIGSQYDALIIKAKQAAQQYDYDYVISSEGSFGPHPHYYFMPGAIEMMAFIDMKKELIIAETLVTQHTNFDHYDIIIPEAPINFLKKIKFPSHAIILRDLDSNEILSKGIRESHLLIKTIKNQLAHNTRLRIETDMRAHMNPTRMYTIRLLAEKLVQRIATHCPSCYTPGFGHITFSGHLDCEFCDTPTKLYQQKVLNCLSCDFKSYLPRDDGLQDAPQQYCPYCNP